jgi:hypothetical protein
MSKDYCTGSLIDIKFPVVDEDKRLADLHEMLQRRRMDPGQIIEIMSLAKMGACVDTVFGGYSHIQGSLRVTLTKDYQ